MTRLEEVARYLELRELLRIPYEGLGKK